MNVSVLCECESFYCNKSIKIPYKINMEIRKNPNTIIIIDGCIKGPNKTDTLISEEQGYSIYEEQK